MWETTVMHKQVSGRTVNFGPNFPDQSLLRNTPPPENWNLGRSWHFVTFQFQNTPPQKLKFRQILALCDFSVLEYPPPPENWNLGRSWHFVTFQFQNTPPPKIEIYADLGTLWLFSFRIPPPENWNLGRSSQWETMCGKLPHVETLSNPDNYSFQMQTIWSFNRKTFNIHTSISA